MATPNVVPIKKRSLGLPASKYANPAAEAEMQRKPPVLAVTARRQAHEQAMQLKRKTDQCGRVVERLKAAIEQAKARVDRERRRQDRLSARLERIEGRAVSWMQDAGSPAVIGIGYTLATRANAASLVVDQPKLIPATYMRTPKAPPPAPDKIALKAALERGSRKEATAEEKATAAELRKAVHLEQTVSLLVSRVE